MSEVQSTGPRKRTGPRDVRWYCDVDSPVGTLRIVVGSEAVIGLYHGEHVPPPTAEVLGHPVSVPSDPPAGVPRGHVMPHAAPRTGDDAGGERIRPIAAAGESVVEAPDTSRRLLVRTAGELREYFAGSRRRFDVTVVLQGTAFQCSVWAALRDIPFGERRSYRDIAEQLGNASMGRAVGAAVRANPVSIIVPGHRIVASTGAVVGYAAGIGVKTALLEHETAVHPRNPLRATAPAESGEVQSCGGAWWTAGRSFQAEP